MRISRSPLLHITAPPSQQRPMLDILLCVLFVSLSYLVIGDPVSGDLRAVWFAARYLAEGKTALVYPAASVPFQMLAPPEWYDRAASEGYAGTVYPYLYPPLWAWLFGKLTGVATFTSFKLAATLINPWLLVGTLVGAWRIAAADSPRSPFLLIGFLVLLCGSTGAIALFQNQPQILVAFLTIWAIERAERDHPVTAGILLALAAALKLYPAFYVLFWLALGKRRAAGAFVIFGGLLGLASIAACGWPLHRHYLDLVLSISRTAMLTRLSFIWEGVLAQWFYPDMVRFVADPGAEMAHVRFGWWVMEKPPALAWGMRFAFFGALALLLRSFYRSRTAADRALLWPVAFATLSLLGPMSWTYHYLTLVAFAPCLSRYLKPATAALVLIMFCALTGTYLWYELAQLRLGSLTFSYNSIRFSDHQQTFGTLMISILAGATVVAHKRTGRVMELATSAENDPTKDLLQKPAE